MLRNTNPNELITILLVIGLTLISVAKLIAPKRFNEFIIILGNSKYLKIYSREQKLFNIFDFLLFINLIVSLSVFIITTIQNYTDTKVINSNLVLKFIVGIGVFIILRTGIEYFIGKLLDNNKISHNYLFQKISYKNYIGIFLLLANALLVYAFPNNLILSYIFLSIALIINSIGGVLSYKNHQETIKQNLFYFILYLCTLEIAPYIILCKIFIA